MKEGACQTSSCGMEGHVYGNGHCLKVLKEQHCQLAKLYGRLSMSDKSEMELIADCHGVTEVNLLTALGFFSIESLERLEFVTSLSVEVFPGSFRQSRKLEAGGRPLRTRWN